MNNRKDNRRSNRAWQRGNVRVYHRDTTVGRVRDQVRWPWHKIERFTRLDERPHGDRFSDS